MWRSIFEYGTLTATNSLEIGLVNSFPYVDPLISLLDVTKRNDAITKLEEQLKILQDKLKEIEEKIKKVEPGPKEHVIAEKKKVEDMCKQMEENFRQSIEAIKASEEKLKNVGVSKLSATDEVSLLDYKRMLDKKSRVERSRTKLNAFLYKLSEKSTATSIILSGLGFQPKAVSGGDKIAVVTVDGSIGNSLSHRIINSLRKIRKDENVRCVVLRVNSPGGSVKSSESILEEIKALEKVITRVVLTGFV